VPRHSDSLVDIVQRLGYILLLHHHALVLPALWSFQWVGELRTLRVHHYNLHTHCLRDHEDVGEDDGGINEAFVALNGLEGKSRCDLGAAAAFEEIVFAFYLVILREVTTGYMPLALMGASS
jgi:hypothetical protein